MKLPTGSGWTVKHGADFQADVVKTKNLAFDKHGLIRPARKPIALYNTNDSATFGKVVAIVPDDTNSIYYAITSNKMYTITASPFAVAPSTLQATDPTFTSGSDAVFFKGINGDAQMDLHVSTSTEVYQYQKGPDGFYGPANIAGLSASYPHPMAIFDDRLELSIGNGNKVQNYNSSYVNNGSSAPYTLTIPPEYVVSCLRWKGGMMYVGTRHIYGGEAKVFLWNGAGTTAPAGHGVGSSWVYSMCDYKGTMAVCTSAGQILLWNGSGFTELDHFPVYETPYSWEANASVVASSAGNVFNRGMTSFGDLLYINIKGDVSLNAGDYPGPYLHSQPSGLWIYEPGVGLYHHAGHQYDKYQTLTITALSSNTLTTGTHNLSTGDPLLAQSVPNITGLAQYQTYFCVKVSATTMQLAFSRADALNGNVITLSGTPSGDTLRADTTASYGQVYDTIAGAICPMTKTLPRPFYGTEILYGCEPIDATGTTIRSLNSLGNQANRGYLITSPIPAQNINDTYSKLVLLISELLYDADAVVMKYRLKRHAGYPTPGRINGGGLAAWTSTTTFTIDSTVKDCRSVQVGDEAEIVSGAAAGCISKITTISGTSGTITFTVADAQQVSVGDKSEVIFEDWITMNTFTRTSNNIEAGYLEAVLGDGTRNSMVQFKVELRGYDLKLRTADSVSTPAK